MAGLLRDRPSTPEQRLRNAAQHQPWVVGAVLAMLAVYAYLFTQAAAPLGLPLPEQLADALGWHPAGVFDSDHNVDSEIWLYRAAPGLGGDAQRLVLFGAIAGAFLSAYFLPMRHKQASLVLWFLLAGLVLFGGATLAGLLAAHLAIYLLFHAPSARLGLALGAGCGALGYLAWAGDAASLVGALLWGGAVMELYRHGLPRLEQRPRALAAARVFAAQSVLAVTLVGGVWEGLGGAAWRLPAGIMLFFWQWRRLMLYQLDYAHGQVPRELPVSSYLALFLTPATLPNWHWGNSIGLGYSYLDHNHYAVDKNRLALDGVKIWGIALVYLVFGEWIRRQLVAIFTGFGVEVHHAHLQELSCHFVHTGTASTATVLATTLLDQARWLLLWAGALHFRVGLWRVFGYRMDPYYNQPWLATNLVALWTRFTFHYREFLVRMFFYPVFFRYFRERTRLRVFCATLAAACFGNWIWGHVPYALVEHPNGLRFQDILTLLEAWPYFLLLGISISLTELYLLGRRNPRKPWTLDRRFPLDLLAAYLTLQFYSLIHVFITPCENGSLGDYAQLFLLGFGLRL
jgi:hypothetical protein